MKGQQCPCLFSLKSQSSTDTRVDNISRISQDFTKMLNWTLVVFGSLVLVKCSMAEIRHSHHSKDENISNSSPYPSCLSNEAQGRGRVCNTVYECKEKCDKNDCQTKYEYKCTDYKRKECRRRWQNFCQSDSSFIRSNRVKRTVDIVGKLFWDKLSKLFAPVSQRRHDNPMNHNDSLQDQHRPGQGDEESLSDSSGQCWRLVTQCQWVKYNTVCQNKPITTCKVSSHQKARIESSWQALISSLQTLSVNLFIKCHFSPSAAKIARMSSIVQPVLLSQWDLDQL